MTNEQMLHATLGELDSRMRRLKMPADLSDARIDLFVVTTAMLTRVSEIAKAVSLLVQFRAGHTGGGPLTRALWELSLDLSYLVVSDNPERNATKAMVNGVLEMLDCAREIANNYGRPEGETEMHDLLERRRTTDPDVVAEVTRQRRQRKFHWSGRSHSAISMELAKTPVTYRALSWEAHAAMSSIRSVKVTATETGATLSIGGSASSLFSDDTLASIARNVVVHAWNDYAKVWNLPALA